MVDLGYSGDDITNHLLNSLENLGLRSCSSVHRDLANDIKVSVADGKKFRGSNFKPSLFHHNFNF